MTPCESLPMIDAQTYMWGKFGSAVGESVHEGLSRPGTHLLTTNLQMGPNKRRGAASGRRGGVNSSATCQIPVLLWGACGVGPGGEERNEVCRRACARSSHKRQHLPTPRERGPQPHADRHTRGSFLSLPGPRSRRGVCPGLAPGWQTRIAGQGARRHSL